MENLLKNELFTHVSTEELEKMIPCFEMTKRSFREKGHHSHARGGKKLYLPVAFGDSFCQPHQHRRLVGLTGISGGYGRIRGSVLPLPIRRMRF